MLALHRPGVDWFDIFALFAGVNWLVSGSSTYRSQQIDVFFRHNAEIFCNLNFDLKISRTGSKAMLIWIASVYFCSWCKSDIFRFCIESFPILFFIQQIFQNFGTTRPEAYWVDLKIFELKWETKFIDRGCSSTSISEQDVSKNKRR